MLIKFINQQFNNHKIAIILILAISCILTIVINKLGYAKVIFLPLNNITIILAIAGFFIIYKNPILSLPLLAFCGLGLSQKDLYLAPFWRVGYPYIFLAFALILTFLYFYPKKITFQLRIITWLTFLFLILMTISLLYTKWLYGGLFILITFICLDFSTFLLALIWSANLPLKKIKYIFYFLISLILLAGLAGIYKEIITSNFQRFSFSFGSPNTITPIFVVGFLSYIIFFKEISIFVPKILNYLFLLLIAFWIIGAQSKSGFISFLIGIFVFCLFQKKIKKQSALSLFGISLIILIIVSLTILPSAYTYRYRDAVTYLITQKRTPQYNSIVARVGMIQDSFLPFWFKTLFPGTGIGSSPSIAPSNRYQPIETTGPVAGGLHDIFLQVWINLGLIGLIIFLLIIYETIKHARYLIAQPNEHIHKIGLICLIGLIVKLVSGITAGGDLFDFRMFWFFVGLTEGVALKLALQKKQKCFLRTFST